MASTFHVLPPSGAGDQSGSSKANAAPSIEDITPTAVGDVVKCYKEGGTDTLSGSGFACTVAGNDANWSRIMSVDAAGDYDPGYVVDCNSAVAQAISPQGFWRISGIDFRNSTGSTINGSATDDVIVDECVFQNSGAIGIYLDQRVFISNCSIVNPTTFGIYVDSQSVIDNCLVIGGTDAYVLFRASYLLNSIADNPSGDAVDCIGASNLVCGNVFYSAGIGVASANRLDVVLRNLFHSCTVGLQNTAGYITYEDYNLYHNNGTDRNINGTLIQGGNSVDDDVNDPCNDAANGDFDTVSGSGLRAVSRTVGASWYAGASTSYITAGLPPDAAGGGLLVHPGMTGGFRA